MLPLGPILKAYNYRPPTIDLPTEREIIPKYYCFESYTSHQ